MRYHQLRYVKYVVIIIFLFSCDTKQASRDHAEKIINQIQEKFAPDKRVALFDVETGYCGQQIVLRGESNLPVAVDILRSRLKAEGISFVDSINLLPSQTLKDQTYAVAKLSVANMRSEPRHSAELATQAILGTPLKVLKKRRGWYLIQTPDKYIAWVDGGGIETMKEEEFDQWITTEKLMYIKPFGFSYEEPNDESQTVSDLVSGSILALEREEEDYYKVLYPHGVTAYVAKTEMIPYEEWVSSLNPTGSTLVVTAKGLMGLPYLWGGTSFKGVDCSGFTKIVYFLNGMIIPRDASQQVHAGQLVDSVKSFDKLMSGDLLFFGSPATGKSPERVVHVGMWIGNNEFIHSAGSVHISSVDSTAENFDKYNYDRYLRSRRLLQENDDKVVHLTNSRIF